MICGDFNVGRNSETLDIFQRAGMVELVTDRGFRSTRTSRYKKPGKSADYMLVNDPSAIKDFNVVSDPEVSDHCPLVLDL